MQHPGFEPCVGGTSIGCSTIELYTYLLVHLYCYTSAVSFMLTILYMAVITQNLARVNFSFI